MPVQLQNSLRGCLLLASVVFFLKSFAPHTPAAPPPPTKRTSKKSDMMLRVYSAALVIVELPTILKLLRGEAASTVSPWFPRGAVDSMEFNAVYAGWLIMLCIARTMVISYPKSRGILFNAAVVHAVEIPLYGFLAWRLGWGELGWLSRGILAAILLNPFFFLQAALQTRLSK